MSEIDLLIKLFDTLKESSKETQQLCHGMLTNQNNIGNYIKQLPMSDLKEALKEHSKEAADDIGVCTETVETKTDNILDRVKIIENKIGKMILVVIVVVGLFSFALLVGTLARDKDEPTHLNLKEVIQEQNKTIDEHKQSIDDLEQRIKERMNELHKKK